MEASFCLCSDIVPCVRTEVTGRGDSQANVLREAAETSSFNTLVTYSAIMLLLAAECLCVPVPVLLGVRAITSAMAPTLQTLEWLLSPWWCCPGEAPAGSFRWKLTDAGAHKRHKSLKRRTLSVAAQPHRATAALPPSLFKLSKAGSRAFGSAQTDTLCRSDGTPGSSGISGRAGCSIYALVMSGQMGHAAPADCWAGCHWESHSRAADTLGTPLFVPTT